MAHLVYRSVICPNAFPFVVYAGFVEVPEKPPQLASEVNVNPLCVSLAYNKPLIHVYEKEFSSEICCGSLWGKFEFGFVLDPCSCRELVKLVEVKYFTITSRLQMN